MHDPLRRDPLAGLALRIGAVLNARDQRYVMLHLAPDRIGDLTAIFSGLAAPTVLPLAGRDDLVAVHLVVSGKLVLDPAGQAPGAGRQRHRRPAAQRPAALASLMIREGG